MGAKPAKHPAPTSPVIPLPQDSAITTEGPYQEPLEKSLGEIAGLLGPTEVRPKYPLLQRRQLMYFRLDQPSTNAMITLLERTKWTQTDAGMLIVKVFFSLLENGGLQILLEKRLFESNDPKDLKRIRDILKPTSSEINDLMKNSLWKQYRTQSRRSAVLPPEALNGAVQDSTPATR